MTDIQPFHAAAESLIDCIRTIYGQGSIALHEPRFTEIDIDAVAKVVRSSFVSTVGAQITEFENALKKFTGAGNAIAVVNGTSALHAALLGCGVQPGDEVITQSLTFVATCNAIRYCQAHPVFIDVDDSLGLSPMALRAWLEDNVIVSQGRCINKHTGRRVSVCLPMHTFGFPAKLSELVAICDEYLLTLIEDAAEGLGSFYKGAHVGRFGRCATLSFNGNKIITTGGGGAVMTDDDALASRIRHLTTTAKAPMGWASYHDEVGYNYRLPNLNAGLGVAQMQHLPTFILEKQQVAKMYQNFLASHPWQCVTGESESRPNFWLNCVILPSEEERDAFIALCANQNIQVRPAWTPMHNLPMFVNCQRGSLIETEKLAACLVNLPSSATALIN